MGIFEQSGKASIEVGQLATESVPNFGMVVPAAEVHGHKAYATLNQSPSEQATLSEGGSVAGAVRAIFIALLITLLGIVFVHTAPTNWGLYLVTIVLVAVLFSALGIIFGLLAEKFDHIAVLTTFFITPLVFVGGVFTSIHFLPPLVQKISLINPMFYMIDAFRYSYIGTGVVSLWVSLGVVALLAAVAFGVALRMAATGFKLRT